MHLFASLIWTIKIFFFFSWPANLQFCSLFLPQCALFPLHFADLRNKHVLLISILSLSSQSVLFFFFLNEKYFKYLYQDTLSTESYRTMSSYDPLFMFICWHLYIILLLQLCRPITLFLPSFLLFPPISLSLFLSLDYSVGKNMDSGARLPCFKIPASVTTG